MASTPLKIPPSSNGKAAGNGQGPQHNRLDGWKEIADYLGRDIRTCQRWALKLGLPAHRIDSESNRAKVFAFQSEIDDWLKSKNRSGLELPEKRPTVQKPQKRLMAMAVLAVIVALAGFWIIKVLLDPGRVAARSTLGPVRSELRGKSLAFFDSDDNLLWDWPVDLPADFQKYDSGATALGISTAEAFAFNCVDFADIDGDGLNEAAAFHFDKDPSKRTVILFDHDGKKKIWENKPYFPNIYPNGTADHDLYIRSLFFQKLPGRDTPSLLVLWNNYKYAPSSFNILEGKSGHLDFCYENVGNLRSSRMVNLAGKPYIFLSGTNNLAHCDGACIILNPVDLQSGLGPPYTLSAESNSATSSPELLRQAVRASQVQYIRIRRTPLSEELNTQWLWVTDAAIEGTQLFLSVQVATDCFLYYFFDRDFRFIGIKDGGDFSKNFPEWRRSGKVDVSLEEYLRRRAGDVSYWDGQGWKPEPVIR